MILTVIGELLRDTRVSRAVQRATATPPPADVLDDEWLTTAAQLDALPLKAVVLSPDMSVFQRWPNGWYAVCDRRMWTAQGVLVGIDVVGQGKVRRIA